MSKFTFIDKRPKFNVAGYPYPNEHLPTLRELAGRAAPSKAAAICSGGEVPLTVLLPIADEVVAVDHSYLALTYACIKALLMEDFNAEGIKKFWSNLAARSFSDFFKDYSTRLPEGLKGKYDQDYFDEQTSSNLRNIWLDIPNASIDAAREKLDKITFVHGDLSDLPDFGTFDLTYASNAMGHSDYQGRFPLAQSFLAHTKRTGYLIHTNITGPAHDVPSHWTQIIVKHDVPGRFTHGEMNWSYFLHGRKLSVESWRYALPKPRLRSTFQYGFPMAHQFNFAHLNRQRAVDPVPLRPIERQPVVVQKGGGVSEAVPFVR